MARQRTAERTKGRTTEPGSKRVAPRARDPVRHKAFLYLCFFGSGAAGLTLEIVWSKYLSYLLGNSIYGVATVVAAFLGGLGLGALVGGRLAASTRPPLLSYPRLELLVAALGLPSPLPHPSAPPPFASLYGAM